MYLPAPPEWGQRGPEGTQVVRSPDCGGSVASVPMPGHLKLLFSTSIFFIFPTSQAKGGPRSGEWDTGPSVPRGVSTQTQWTAPPVHAVPGQPPHPRTQGNICQAHSSGFLATDSVWPRGWPPWHPGASSPPLPPTCFSTELPVWDNLEIFFWGIILLHDP